jgi:hypothetical protein
MITADDGCRNARFSLKKCLISETTGIGLKIYMKSVINATKIEHLIMAVLNRIELVYNVMKETAYFVSL